MTLKYIGLLYIRCIACELSYWVLTDDKGFLPYMGMVAILVMWPEPFEQTFVAPS